MHRTMIPKLVMVVITAVLFGAAENHPQAPPLQPAEPVAVAGGATVEHSFAERYPRYELRAGDIFEVSFEFSPEFNQTVSVQPDGFVTLREIGDVQVSGQTVPQLTSTIKMAYSKVLNDPALSIVLKDFEKPYFIAAGNVAHPGKYELRGDTTVTQAVAIAGGFTEAKTSRVVLYRRVSKDWMEGKVIDVKKMMVSRNLSEDAHLNPNDMVFVPQSRFSKFQRFIPAPGIGLGAPIP